MEWDRALHRWAKEYDALLFRFVEQIGGKPMTKNEIEPDDLGEAKS